MGDAVVGGAVGEARTASLGAGVAGTAFGGLGVISGALAAHEAQTRHDGEAVGLGLSSSNSGHCGNGDDGGKVHLERIYGKALFCCVSRRGAKCVEREGKLTQPV